MEKVIKIQAVTGLREKKSSVGERKTHMQMKCYDRTPSFQVGGVGLTPIICSKLWERLGFLLHWLLSSGVENSTYGGVKMVKLYSDKNIFCKINTKKSNL